MLAFVQLRTMAEKATAQLHKQKKVLKKKGVRHPREFKPLNHSLLGTYHDPQNKSVNSPEMKPSMTSHLQ